MMVAQARYLTLLISVSFPFIARILDWKLSLASSIIFAISVAILIAFIADIKERYEKHNIFEKGNLPSIENKNPYSGNLIQANKNKNFFKFMEIYHNRLGETFGYFHGSNAWAVTSNLDLIQQVFVTDSDKYINTPDLGLSSVLINESTIQLHNDKWRNTRRSLNPSFSHKQIKTDDVGKDIEDSCAKLLEYIASQAEQCEEGRIVDVLHRFAEYSIDIIIKLVLDRRDGITKLEDGQRDKLSRTLLVNLKSIMSPIIYLTIISDLLRRPLSYLSGFSQFGRTSSYLCSVFDDSLKLRKQQILEAGSSDNKLRLGGSTKMIDTLLNWAHDNKMKDISVISQMWFFFAAGSETSGNTLTVLFWFLAKNQDIQNKLRQAIILEGEEATYLLWCINETLRLYPAVPGTGRILTEDINLKGDRTLFKGTNLIANIYAIHHDRDYWGPDVEDFRPERFSEPLGHKVQFFAFSGGPRSCIGKHLAYRQMKAIICKILLLYCVEPCLSTPDELKWQAPNLLHMFIAGPIKLKFINLNYRD